MTTTITYRKKAITPQIRCIDDTTDRYAGNEPVSCLLPFEKLPEWYEGNDCIHQGYRPPVNSIGACFQSWAYTHNETANIYTHLIPSLAAACFQIILYQYFVLHYPKATPKDKWVILGNIWAAVVCWGFSALYHTLMNHSASYVDIWIRIDYTGILTLILGSFISGIYVSFYCNPKLQITYWSMIVTLGIISACILLHPYFQHPKFRLFRLYTFIITGLSGFVPIIHALRIYSPEHVNEQTGLLYYYAEGVLVLLGAFLYATRFPEVQWPGKFDIWGGSHQIFHVLVVIAAIIHFVGVMKAYRWNYYNSNCSVVL